MKSWGSTQTVVASSSGESEWYAMLKGASVVLGIKSMVGELGVGMDVEVRTRPRPADLSALESMTTLIG